MKHPPSVPASLLLLPSAQDDTLQCLWIDADGSISARGPLAADAAPASGRSSGVRCILAIPGHQVGSQWLELKARNEAQALAAARLLLEERLAGGGDDLHVVLAAPPDAGTRRQVLYLAPAVLRHHLDRARTLGFEPDMAIPDYMLLPAPQAPDRDEARTAAATVFERDGQWLVRAPELAFGCEAGLAETVLAGAPPTTPVADTGQVEAVLARGAVAVSVDLLQGRFTRAEAQPSDLPRWRRVALLAGLLALSPLLLVAVGAARYGIAASALRSETAATVQDLGAAVGGDPITSLQDALISTAAGDRFARLNAALHGAISTIPTLQLERLDYRRDKALEAVVAHPARGDLDELRRRLSDAGLRLEVGGTRDGGGGLSTTIRIDERPPRSDAPMEARP
ncbi:type II secretion system protein GspL [Marilutibacter maris]|uniref:type II secretion system protein GspL n=1 Tax=Marilutibacter maris TaxID=1605891 RepID=UPI000DAA91F0|nr:type II secretion system protein GspL [Lysobacter maris]